jgi:prepilin-type processing-associated H-X9-DG protein
MRSGTTAADISGHANFGFSDGHVKHWYTTHPYAVYVPQLERYECPHKWEWNGSLAIQ